MRNFSAIGAENSATKRRKLEHEKATVRNPGANS